MASSASDSNQAILRIGTRGSPLALAQADETRTRLIAAHPHLASPGAIEIRIIKTTGDKEQNRLLNEIGGKGLFTKEIEEALLAGDVDIAVHSMKDMPTFLPEGLVISCLLPREDPRDVLITTAGTSIATLPQGAVVGSASLRRAAQIKALRPDLSIVPLRGNVETRIAKVQRGDATATLLALAGLKRLHKANIATAILSTDEILPAVAQGAIGIESRAGDDRVNELLAPLNDPQTEMRVTTERACLAVLEGSCRTPIAALAELQGDRLRLRALVALPDGSKVYRQDATAAASDARKLGEQIGRKLKELAGPDFLP
ncbi:hydroxymethylbilane synthase [Dongia deserti]|uniref:hydroxymethylbilane synthase n=1 Tax=Dongia deserti TaxID=2268030 RepID=UPI000E65DFAD|nr:hydroxymethylbilane synthase [Dongia deserti]